MTAFNNAIKPASDDKSFTKHLVLVGGCNEPYPLCWLSLIVYL